MNKYKQQYSAENNGITYHSDIKTPERVFVEAEYADYLEGRLDQLERAKEEKIYFQVYRDKRGELDFGVRGLIYNLDLKGFNELRSMIMAGIGIMEGMWRRNQERQQNTKSDVI